MENTTRRMFKKALIISALSAQMLASCHNPSTWQNQANEKADASTDRVDDRISTEYESENLIIRKISDHVYEHISFLSTNDFGRVPCNGMIVVNNNEAVVFDTPTHDEDAQALINYLTENLHCKINGIVATHFHADCLGSLGEFHKYGIPSFANNQTIELAKGNNATAPQHGFNNHLELEIGNKKVYTEFFGEGHTKDNVVGYFPDDKIMFGGCLIKAAGAGKGNLEDANITAWSETVGKIKTKYPQLEMVIPGHGELGGTELLDYTISMFE